MENQFYLVCRHGNCGSNVMFHNKDEHGYGTDLDKLHLYTAEQAQKALNHDIKSLPLLRSAVDALSIKAVDHQYLNEDLNGNDPNDEYVVQIKNCWNGNDIGFSVMGGITYNYEDAHIFDFLRGDAYSRDDDSLVLWSKSYLDSISRRTFQEININTRKMITGAGIKYTKPRKQKETTGKVRWNCPTCGKINWQFNPYDFDGCNHVSCDAWRPSYSM